MGPLGGLTVIEMAGLGPAPFCGMMLADAGARVIRVDRIGGIDGRRNILCRNRQSIAVDLQTAEGREIVLDLIDNADALIEGFRPGVMERLGLAPDICLQRNPKLVFARMTGWGQDGPLAGAAGHDINYISLAGVAHAVGRANEGPVVPLNLVGDYGGGGMMLAFGVMAAAWRAAGTGKGQIIDAAMVDGASALMAEYYGFLAAGEFEGDRGTHLLDGGAPFYGLYETSDGEFISIGPLEPKFYALLRDKLGLDDEVWSDQMDKANWPSLKDRMAQVIATKTRAKWTELLEGTDVCFAPVLSMREFAQHPINRTRRGVVEIDGLLQPAPAPRFSDTVSDEPRRGRRAGEDTVSVLESLRFEASRIDTLLAAGIIEQTGLEEN
jgi:alpha-methylacyl-CoA racemase